MSCCFSATVCLNVSDKTSVDVTVTYTVHDSKKKEQTVNLVETESFMSNVITDTEATACACLCVCGLQC